MSEKLIVCLHGYGDSAAGWAAIAPRIAGYFNTQNFLVIDAPFATDFGGYKWFDLFHLDGFGNPIWDKPRYDDFDGIDFSTRYIKEKIAVHCADRGLDNPEIILCGHSQGAFMSLFLTVTGEIRPVQTISICGFYPENILKHYEIKNRNTPILWLGAGKDDVLSLTLQDSYKLLQAKDLPITYYCDTESDHNYWSPAMFAEIEKQG